MASSLRSLLLATVGACMVLGFSGCASTYRFKVDAVKNPDITEQKSSYRLVSGNPQMDSEDLRFKEAAGYVKTALSSKGMYEAPAGTDAEMVIEVDFGMEEPRTETRTVEEPVYVTEYLPPVERMVPMKMRDGTIKMVRVIEYPTRQRFVGTKQNVYTVTIYEKYTRITAREAQSSDGERPPRELWSVYVKNDDERDDLRQYVPLMVSAAMDSVAENGSAAKEVVLSDQDERVTFVKKGLQDAPVKTAAN